MAFDPSRINIRSRVPSTEVDPERIFQALTLRGSIENLWSPQAEALRAWHAKRAQNDVVIEMNTGGGKTLVGLLVAVSLARELRRQVLYVCPNNQLVEQTRGRSLECGIDVASYHEQEWFSRDVFDKARGPCITNYAAVFNGRSIFRKMDVAALLLDDAHVAPDLIRAQFTLSLKRGTAHFDAVAKLLRPCFAVSGRDSSFQQVLDGDPRVLLFVPAFEMRKLAPKITSLLLANAVNEDKDLCFAWEHLKDHVDRCAVMASGSRIEITPVALPLHTLRAMSADVRRVYLTATLPSPDQFIRTFGAASPDRVSPSGKSGEAQRLFVFAPGETDDEQRGSSRELVKKRKACIIVPSKDAADPWLEDGRLYDKREGHAGIEAFACDKGTKKLILAARYDGIDLPGDACRVLVLDGQPRGEALLDRFMDESLQVSSLRAARRAIRFVQAIGRIFRSNTDHGAVLLCGDELQRWCTIPANLAFLPALVQRQLEFAAQLRENVEQENATFPELIDAVLTGERSWDRLYKEGIASSAVERSATTPAWLADMALREHGACRTFWDGNFAEAATAFASLADDTRAHDARLAAWFQHWEGAAILLGGNEVQASRAFSAAANVRAELGRPRLARRPKGDASGPSSSDAQVQRILAEAERRGARAAGTLDGIVKALVYGPDTAAVEEALKVLGTMLGLDSSRPDKEERTGPDVLWLGPSRKEGVALEAKTDKKPGSQYRKTEDVAQFHDHAGYLKKKYKSGSFRKVIVGPLLRVSPESNPPDDLLIVEVGAFVDLATRTRELYASLATAGPDGARDLAAWTIEMSGLAWPNCIDSMPSRLAVDLQVESEPGADVS